MKYPVKVISFLFLVMLLSSPALANREAGTAPDTRLVGKWGVTALIHGNNGSWNSVAGTTIFKSDGSGTETKKYNDGGIPGEITEDFTYSTTGNPDGSITVTEVFADRTETHKVVLSDNGNMLIVDGTADITEQSMVVGVRMDETKTYSNADLSGDYYGICYAYYPSGSSLPSHNDAWSATASFNGNGSFSHTSTANGDGIIYTSSETDTYSVNSDGSFSGGSDGYITGDGSLFVISEPASIQDWLSIFFMKKGDRTYSNADIEGTWALVGFGDDNGSSFNTNFGSMTCDGSGHCIWSLKMQTDGSVEYDSGGRTLPVASDGSFGTYLGDLAPAYAGAIGNNGNTIIFNASFESDELYHREIFLGVRCNDCYNLAGQMIPMISLNPNQLDGGNGINIYLYNPASGVMNAIKENSYDSWLPSMNSDRTRLVYTEGIKNGDYTIKVYDIASGVSAAITTASARRAAYFDGGGKILFLDSIDGLLKRMNPDGSNINTVAAPETPYSFSVFWISPDRKKIIVNEYRQVSSDYGTDNYDRLVLMNSDGTGRTVIKDEYLGYWNMLAWKPDSSGFLYYHHVFDVVDGVDQVETPRYVLIDISDGTETDLSGSDIAKEENLCLPTRWGNLLSISYRELYNGETGNLIMDVSQDVPLLTETMLGWDNQGEIYFADLDGSNFRRFVESAFSSYDTNEDWTIGDFELLNAIDDWVDGNLGDFDLLNLIDYWAFGSYCWDTAAESYEAGVPGESGVCIE